MREFLYVDDLADAIYLLLKKTNHKILNIGSGEEISIINLANKIANIVKFEEGLFSIKISQMEPQENFKLKNIRSLRLEA